MADSPGVHLVRTDENVDEIEALAARLGGRVGLPVLLGDLHRRARRALAPGRAVRRAWTWDAADRRDPVWWPQGVTTADGFPGVVAVSWYAKDDQGSRITFLDLERRRYRHVLFVEPQADGSVRPLKVHAGGIVWHGPYLHVAATARGVYTCRFEDLVRVSDEDAAGLGYRYLLPVRFAYRAKTDEGQQKLRYSFLSLNRGASPPELVVGEYGNAKQTRRLARFPVDPETSFLIEEEGVARPLALDESGVNRAQGAAIAHGRWYVTTSHGPWTPGSVWVGEPGAFVRHRWATPMGPEDIAWDDETDLLWSVTEHPRRRWVVSMQRSWFERSWFERRG